jgi:tryptophan-rich sensory protein
MSTPAIADRQLLEWVTFTVVLTLSHVSLMLSGDSGDFNSDWYRRLRKRVAGVPPSWMFGIAWTIVSLLITFSAFNVFIEWEHALDAIGSTDSADVYHATWVLYLVLSVLLAAWTPLFAARYLGAALGLVLLIDTVAIALLVLFILAEFTASIVMFAVAMVWLIYATYLSGAFYAKSAAAVAGTAGAAVLGRSARP